MNEENIIIRTYSDIFIHSDARQWEKVKACFAEEVYVDYTSLSGQPPGTISGSVLVNTWAAVLPKFKFTLHYLTNHRVTIRDNSASAFCYGHAIHQLPGAQGGDLWEVYGTYDFGLEKTRTEWKVISIRYNHQYAAGNLNLPALAARQ